MSATLGNRACVDPKLFREQCEANGLPLTPWWGRANGFDLSPLGPAPGRGWLLLSGESLSALSQIADHDLVFLGTFSDRKITLRSITLVSAQCVSPGFDGDPHATHLAQVADRRHHLARMAPVSRAFNVSAADGASYLSATLNAGSEWTWQEVVDELATELDLETAQFVLPFTPHGEPENLTYWGVFAWDALNDVLDRIGCAARYDIETDVFSVVRLGDEDTFAAGAQADSLAERVWDAYPTDPVRGWRPQKVRVKFLRRPRPGGDDAGEDPYYAVDVTLEAADGVVADTFVQLDDDLSAIGATGTPTNLSTLTGRANERAQDWLTKRLRFGRPLLKVYRDFLPEIVRNVPGATVGSVALDDRGGPMRTEIKSTPDSRLEDWKPLSKLPPWFPADGTDGDGTGTAASCGGGCGSLLSAADHADVAFALEVLCNTGSFDHATFAEDFDGVSISGAQFRRTAAATWTLQYWDGAAWAAWELNTGTADGAAVLTFDATDTGNRGMPILRVDAVALRTTCDERDAVFRGGPRNGFVGAGSVPTPGGCDPDDFTLRVSCACKWIDGFVGDGYYCVVAAAPAETCGVDDAACVYLKASDGSACDATIQICDGPFEGADCDEMCEIPAGPTDTLSCDSGALSYTIPVQWLVTLTNPTGDITSLPAPYLVTLVSNPPGGPALYTSSGVISIGHTACPNAPNETSTAGPSDVLIGCDDGVNSPYIYGELHTTNGPYGSQEYDEVTAEFNFTVSSVAWTASCAGGGAIPAGGCDVKLTRV